jgi:hypothetical protein
MTKISIFAVLKMMCLKPSKELLKWAIECVEKSDLILPIYQIIPECQNQNCRAIEDALEAG